MVSVYSFLLLYTDAPLRRFCKSRKENLHRDMQRIEQVCEIFLFDRKENFPKQIKNSDIKNIGVIELLAYFLSTT